MKLINPPNRYNAHFAPMVHVLRIGRSDGLNTSQPGTGQGNRYQMKTIKGTHLLVKIDRMGLGKVKDERWKKVKEKNHPNHLR